MQLFKGPHLDLADTLTADTEFGGQILKRQRWLGQPAGLEDALLAFVQVLHRVQHEPLAGGKFLMFGKGGFLVLGVILEPVLPFAASLAIA